MSMLNAMTISDMAIVIFIIKHPTFSGRNVMLRYLTVLMGGARAANFFFLTMLRQHSQYDSRLGFSFRALVRLGLG